VFKFAYRVIPAIFFVLFGMVTLAHAQSASAYFGVGAATDSSNGQVVDGVNEGPSLNGVFLTIGGDVMPKQALGFGAEYSWRAARLNYAPDEDVTARPIFYDFNAIWHPVTKWSKVIPEFQGGLGGADVKFYETESGCVQPGACTTLNQYLASSDHFQVHFAGGVRIYVTPSIFIKPQVDVHYVHNYEQFGSNWVPEFTVSVGFTGGQH
jgi:hypothetical protein